MRNGSLECPVFDDQRTNGGTHVAIACGHRVSHRDLHSIFILGVWLGSATGMTRFGLISHEAPRLSDHGPVPYAAYDADRPLQPGMVIPIETALPHPTRGYIKLEDTLIATETGWEAAGDGARGWNVAGQN